MEKERLRRLWIGLGWLRLYTPVDCGFARYNAKAQEKRHLLMNQMPDTNTILPNPCNIFLDLKKPCIFKISHRLDTSLKFELKFMSHDR